MIGSFIPLALWLFQLEAQEELNALKCQGASRSYLLVCLTIAVICAVVCAVLKSILDRRQTGTPAFRLGFTLALAFVLSSALVAFEPIKDEVLLACRESNEWSRYVFMPDATQVSRGLVLGGVLTGIIYFLILLAWTRVQARS